MRKAISLAILIICLFVIYQYGITYFKETHEIDYTLKNDPYSFQVHETFENGKYYFQIQAGDYTFLLSEENQFNKMKQVIENMEVIENVGTMCIYPVLKNDVSSSITCSVGKQMYSYESLKTSAIVTQFVQNLQAKQIQPIFVEPYQETEEKYKSVTYYPSAIDETIGLWTYRGFSIFENDHSSSKLTLSFDRYENTLSRFVGQYYITPFYTDNKLYEFSSVDVYDTVSHSEETVSLGTTVSNQTYINGVVDGKLYLFDKNTMQQVEINPKSKTARVVASGSEDAIYYSNGDWSTRNIFDFSQQTLLFQYIDESEIKNRYFYQFIDQTEDSYYFYDGIGFYQVYKNSLDLRTLLFEQSNLKHIQVVDGYIYYVFDDTLYKYTPGMERKRILKYDELRYNAYNLYDIYRK